MTMLSVAEARAKARTRLNKSMSTWATQPDSVVVEIALQPPTEKQVLEDQAAAMEWAGTWRTIAAPEADTSTPKISDSPVVDWTERSWARVGRQQIPLRLSLRTPEAVANFVGGDEARQWRRLRDRTATIRSRFDDQHAATSANIEPLASVIKAHAKRILGLAQAEFDTILDVVAWLRDHPVGTLRPRQLPIRGVDSKWFEAHRSLVTALLTAIGHAESVDVLDAEPRMRIRILDPNLALSGLNDISAPVTQLSELAIAPRLVFVFENLESVLAMPAWTNAVAVHGSGYAVDNVARLAWVHGARVIYWGDLDSHGFAILSRLRKHLPHVDSTLMDEATLIDHRDLWVPEPKPHTGVFPELTGTEARVLARLRAEGNVRLEQERIPWVTAFAALTAKAASTGESAPTTGERG